MATQSLMRRLPPVSVMIAGLVLAVMLLLVLFAPLIAPTVRNTTVKMIANGTRRSASLSL